MKIGVVSDTHSLLIPPEVINGLNKTDMVIHAGDFCTVKDVETFSRLKDFKGVYGNMDGADVRKILSRREIFEIEGATIGIFHGEGPRESILDAVHNAFKDRKLDVVVFGHSHQPFNKQIGDTLYFNPGSPNDMVSAPYRSYGILEIKSGTVTGKIVKLKG